MLGYDTGYFFLLATSIYGEDLPERINDADIIIVSKCPPNLNAWEKSQWAEALGLSLYDGSECCGTRKNGRKQYIFFTKTCYDNAAPVFPQGDPRYVYAQRLVLFTGIANDTPLRHYLSSNYKIVKHFNFPDHHKFSRSDIYSIRNAADNFPTSVIMTTEKDCQRVRDSKAVPESMKARLFYAPIKSSFFSEEDKERFTSVLLSYLK